MRGALKIGIVVLAALILAAPAAATFPGGNGKIAFVSGAEIWVVNPDGTGATRLTNNTQDDWEPVWSPVFVTSQIAFASARDGNGNHEIYVMDEDGSDQTRLTLTPPGEDSRGPAWSYDGTQIFFTRYLAGGCSTLMTMNADGSALAPLDPTTHCERRADAAPDGSRIAFTTSPTSPGGYRLFTMLPDGTGVQQLASFISPGTKPRWSPGTVWLAIGDMALTPAGEPTEFLVPSNAEWSPDGSSLLWAGTDPEGTDILVTNERGGEQTSPASTVGPNPAPDWQPLSIGTPLSPYVRPKGATPLQVPLVPSYTECTAPDRTHGPPLAFGSCSAPTLASDHLTVGTPDANAQPAKSAGYMRFDVLVGSPSTQGDQADVVVTFDLTDVRCRTIATPCTDGFPPDYDGELQAIMPMRITDRFNSGLGNQSATAEAPFQSRITIPCAPTTDTTVGSHCTLQTTLDSVVPGQVRESQRAVWGMEAVQIVDGGADGDASTDDYTLFAVPGLFVP